MITFVDKVRETYSHVASETGDEDYARAIQHTWEWLQIGLPKTIDAMPLECKFRKYRGRLDAKHCLWSGIMQKLIRLAHLLIVVAD